MCAEGSNKKSCDWVFEILSSGIGGTTDTDNTVPIYCLPDFAKSDKSEWPTIITEEIKAIEATVTGMFKNNIGSVLTDIGDAKQAIGISLGAGLVWSLIFIKLLSAFAEQIAWCVIVCVQLGLVGACALCFYIRMGDAAAAEETPYAAGSKELEAFESK